MCVSKAFLHACITTTLKIVNNPITNKLLIPGELHLLAHTLAEMAIRFSEDAKNLPPCSVMHVLGWVKWNNFFTHCYITLYPQQPVQQVMVIALLQNNSNTFKMNITVKPSAANKS